MTMDAAAPDADPATAGGRAPRCRRRQRSEGPHGPAQPPWRPVRRMVEPVRAVSDDQLESIVAAAKRVLRETGIDFLTRLRHDARRSARAADPDPGSSQVARYSIDLPFQNTGTFTSSPQLVALKCWSPKPFIAATTSVRSMYGPTVQRLTMPTSSESFV